MKIIAFTGMPFSGKSEAIKIAEEKELPVIRMGDMVWEETKKQGLEINDKNVGFVANQMREKQGKDIWARRTIQKIKTLQNIDLLVIDGIRNFEEINTFKKELGENFVVVAVEVPDEIRYERAMSRGREDDAMDLDLVKERDRREIGWGLDSVIASADIVISNDSSVEEFHKRIREVLNKI
jgi:dephospho-CoA kinase